METKKYAIRRKVQSSFPLCFNGKFIEDRLNEKNKPLWTMRQDKIKYFESVDQALMIMKMFDVGSLDECEIIEVDSDGYHAVFVKGMENGKNRRD